MSYARVIAVRTTTDVAAQAPYECGVLRHAGQSTPAGAAAFRSPPLHAHKQATPPRASPRHGGAAPARHSGRATEGPQRRRCAMGAVTRGGSVAVAIAAVVACISAALPTCAHAAAGAVAAAPPRSRLAPHSVLHVIVDDLRPALGAYGVANAHTPNFDALAASSMVFDRAYAQQAGEALAGPGSPPCSAQALRHRS